MCYAVRIVVAAATRERRMQLRRAAVSAEWEVVGDADNLDEALAKVTVLHARFLVVDAAVAGPDTGALATVLAEKTPRVFLLGVGDVAGADAQVSSNDLADLRDVMAGLLHGSGDHSH